MAAALEAIEPGDADRGEIEILDEAVVWSNDLVQVLNSRVRLPGRRGRAPVEGEQFRIAHAGGKRDGVVIAPVRPGGRLLLVHQFRHPVRLWLREFPRGARDSGESAEEAARRELQEELGCEAERMLPLGRIAPDSGQLASLPHVFLALVLHEGPRHQEATEAIDRTCSYAYTELRDLCARGEIIDAMTLSTVLRLEPHFDGDRLIPF